MTKHAWRLNKYNDWDLFAFEVEAETMGHNGPRCTVCDFFFCHHCNQGTIEWHNAEDLWESECPKEVE